METMDADHESLDNRASAAQRTVPHGGQREHTSGEQDALDGERFDAGVMVLRQCFAAERITIWPDGSRTVLRTVAEQREARAVLGDAQWVVPVTADGYLLPSV
jgi:hypothetical protein